MMSDKLYIPSNPNAQRGVRNVLKYLSDITYEKIVTGGAPSDRKSHGETASADRI